MTPTVEGESTLFLHFSGHGDASRSSVPVLQRDIAELASARDALSKEDTTKVVFLNACQGTEASHDWVGGNHYPWDQPSIGALWPVSTDIANKVATEILAGNWPTAIPAGAVAPVGSAPEIASTANDSKLAPAVPPYDPADPWILDARAMLAFASKIDAEDACEDTWRHLSAALNEHSGYSLLSSVPREQPFVLAPVVRTVYGFAVVIDLDLLSDLRQSLLRLIDGIHATLYLMLVLVLAALSRHPDALSFILIMLATSRCFGHRGEPDDYAFPAHASMSVIVGEASRAV